MSPLSLGWHEERIERLSPLRLGWNGVVHATLKLNFIHKPYSNRLHEALGHPTSHTSVAIASWRGRDDLQSVVGLSVKQHGGRRGEDVAESGEQREADEIEELRMGGTTGNREVVHREMNSRLHSLLSPLRVTLIIIDSTLNIDSTLIMDST